GDVDDERAPGKGDGRIDQPVEAEAGAGSERAAEGDCENDGHGGSLGSVGAISRSRRLRAGSIAARPNDPSHGAISSAITSNQTYPEATPLGGLPSGIPSPGSSRAQRHVPIDVPYSSSAATTRNTPA